MIANCDASDSSNFLTQCLTLSFQNSEAYRQVKKEKPPTFADLEPNLEPVETVTVPEELLCVICHSILNDAVLVFCCAASCCDECIRTALIESDDHECPVCHVKEVSPDTLIPCIKLRKQVITFLNETNPLWQKTLPSVSSPFNAEVVRDEQLSSNQSQDQSRNSTPRNLNKSPTPPTQPLEKEPLVSPAKEDSRLQSPEKIEKPVETSK